MLDASTAKYELISILLLLESFIAARCNEGREIAGWATVGRLCKMSLNVNEFVMTNTLPWYNTINCLTLPIVETPIVPSSRLLEAVYPETESYELVYNN